MKYEQFSQKFYLFTYSSEKTYEFLLLYYICYNLPTLQGFSRGISFWVKALVKVKS